MELPKTFKNTSNEPDCANKRMDDWEKENLPPNMRGQPRLLYCPCPKCNPIVM